MLLQRSTILMALFLSLLYSTFAVAQHQTYATAMLMSTDSELNRKVMALIEQKDYKALAALVKQEKTINAADNKGVMPVHYAAFAGSVEAMNILTENRASVLATPFGNWTTLHYAAYGGHVDMVQLLVKRGVPINARDAGGETPLSYAIEGGHVGVVKWLVGNGADVNAGNNQDQMPLTLAKERKHQQIVDLLLKAGAKE